MRIIYGLDTESIEDPSQVVLLTLPDDVQDVEDYIRVSNGYSSADEQPVVGFDDVREALRLILDAEGLTSIADRVIDSLTDAFGNNHFN